MRKVHPDALPTFSVDGYEPTSKPAEHAVGEYPESKKLTLKEAVVILRRLLNEATLRRYMARHTHPLVMGIHENAILRLLKEYAKDEVAADGQLELPLGGDE